MKSLYYACIITLFLIACGEKAEDFNNKYVSIDQAISQGTPESFESARNSLDSLKRVCETKKAEIEFKTDENSIREAENLTKILGKITERMAGLDNEKASYDQIYTAGKESFKTIESCSNYLKEYPSGLKRNEVNKQYETILSTFIDDVAGALQDHSGSLSETNTEKSLYTLTNYTTEKIGVEPVEYTEEDYTKAVENFNNAKVQISNVINTVSGDLHTPKGNSPKTLKDLFDNYESKLSDMRMKREKAIRGLVLTEMGNSSWVSQANEEIRSYIWRDRGVGGIFSSCNPNDIRNEITQAEDYATTLLSSKIEVMMHYNISSYCGTNGKYKYYDAKFKLVFPIIESQLGTGFFDTKTITQK